MKIYCGDKKVKEKKMETEMEKGKITWGGEVRSGSSNELKWKK